MSYTRGLRPVSPQSLGDFLDTELLRIQTTFSEVDDAIAGVGGGGGVTDGDKGDIVVSGGGTVWNLDAAIIATFAPAVHTHAQSDVTGLVAALAGKAASSHTHAYTDIVSVPTGTVFYRKTAGTGAAETQTLATLKTDLGLTGTNSGDQTTISGNAGSATVLATGRTIAITGDLTWTSPAFDGSGNVTAAGTLANTAVTPGTYTNATVTFDAKGRATSASSGSGPATVLLEQHAASASATLDFTTAISSTYDEYLIEFVNLVPATDNVDLIMRMSTTGGASYDSTSAYAFAYNQSTNAFTGGVGSASTTSIVLFNSADTTITQNALCGSIKLYVPSSTSRYKNVIGQIAGWKNDGGFYMNACSGCYKSTTAVNAFRFLFSSGNITSGTILVYGIVK